MVWQMLEDSTCLCATRPCIQQVKILLPLCQVCSLNLTVMDHQAVVFSPIVSKALCSPLPWRMVPALALLIVTQAGVCAGSRGVVQISFQGKECPMSRSRVKTLSRNTTQPSDKCSKGPLTSFDQAWQVGTSSPTITLAGKWAFLGDTYRRPNYS